MTTSQREALYLKAKDLYEIEGKSINQIAKELNMRHETISNNLKRLGVDVAKTRNQHTSGIKVDENKFSKIETEEQAYFLGLLYADGSVRKDRNEIVLDLQTKDLALIEKFHAFMNNSNTIRKHIIRKNDKEYISYASSFSSKKVKEDLIKLGCISRKSLTITCPNKEQVPDHLFKHFVRGFVDGDGYVRYKSEPRQRIELTILGPEQFLIDLENRMGWMDGSIRKQENIYYLSYYGRLNAYKSIKELYLDSKIYLDRKYEKFLDLYYNFN